MNIGSIPIPIATPRFSANRFTVRREQEVPWAWYGLALEKGRVNQAFASKGPTGVSGIARRQAAVGRLLARAGAGKVLQRGGGGTLDAGRGLL